MPTDLPTPVLTELRSRAGDLLNRALAEEFALSAAARDYHWQVSGPQFRSLNEVFHQQHQELEQWLERLGERARALGVVPRTSWDELINAPRIRPARGADLNAACMLAEMISLHDQVADGLRAAVADCPEPATAELVADLIEHHETAAWMLGELLEDRALAQA